MATLQTIIDSSQYDLRDFGEQEFDETQLVDYLNRMFRVMDDVLISMNSDITRTSATVTLNSGGNTASLPTRSDAVTALWYGQTPIEKRTLSEVMYRYQLNNNASSTGQPVYWAFNSDTFYFDMEADQLYSLTAYYHIKTATLTISDDMPFNDWFNEYFREALITMASKAKKNEVINVDRQFYSLFESIARRIVTSRNFIPKPYHIDF